jgi:prophage regulatory protein
MHQLQSNQASGTVRHGKVLRLQGVIAKTGMSRSWTYAAIKEGKFPKSIKLGDAAVGWLESDIDAWIDERRIAGTSAASATGSL